MRNHARGVHGHAPPETFCTSVHSTVQFSLQNLAVSEDFCGSFLNVALADKSKTKKKKNLKCDLMILKAVMTSETILKKYVLFGDFWRDV